VFKTFAIAASIATIGFGTIAEAQTPRRGGTFRYTAGYGSSFAGMDIHTSNRAQDEIWARAIHRTLYNWDSDANKPVPELVASSTVSPDGLVHTLKLRDDAYFHHGRKLSADDVIWTFNRIMDGSKSYPGARYVRVVKGAVTSRRARPRRSRDFAKIDESTVEMTLDREGGSGLLLHVLRYGDLSRRRSRQGFVRLEADRPRAHSSSWNTCRARASSPNAGRSSTSRACPTPTGS
jgi:peptide/nickel transport system substrate-binding protein